jgi:hypothetical protein
MAIPHAEANHSLCPKLNPRELRSTGPYFGTGPSAVYVLTAEAERPTLLARKTFWECEAEYNPLGKFGASASSRL